MPVASALPLPISSNTPRFPFAMPGTTPHTAPPRAPSASSHISSTTHTSRDTPQSMYYKSQNGSTSDMPDGYEDVGLTPQPHFPSQHYGGPSYLPPMTTSPPPHTPTYVPPPQHALPPDPIHALGFNPTYGQHPNITTQMAGPSQWSSGWRNGPTPGPSNFPYRIPNGHASAGPLPDGYLQQQQRHAMSIGPPGYSAQSGQGLVNGLPRPGSASGDMREPRRRERSHQRERDEDGDREDEVISTIFVVGFPDDMSEREFQNIFTFAQGFEAAMLKFPSGSARSREPTAALLAELTQLAAQQQAALAAGELPPDTLLPPQLEEALAALQMSTTSTSSATTPSAAISLTPSLAGGAFGHNLPHLPTRRQTIGFARFKSRGDALAARDALQGKKIDVVTGATLKAEMAKKNLHTKRGGHTQEELVNILLRSGRLAGLANQPPAGLGQGGQMPRDVWEQWQQQQTTQHNEKGDMGPAVFSSAHTHPHAPTSPPQHLTSPTQRPTDSKALLALAEEADELEGWSAVSMGMTMEGLTPGHNRPTTHGMPFNHEANSDGNADQGGANGGVGAGSNVTATTTSNATQPIHSSSLPLTSPTPSASKLHSATGPHSQSLPQGVNMYRPTSNTLNGYFPNPASGGDYAGSPPDIDGRGLTGPNPADQNPPINTLYVGNLPAMSPPTHPPNFLEESLRALFSRCAGYKRMSFRQKINGPMCFVEFEDVPFAAQAIKELYGHNLGGLVKGGIRLSYSKNSLGQRGNAHPAGVNTSLFGGIAHTVALAGMSSPSTAGGANNGANAGSVGNGYNGLQLNNALLPSSNGTIAPQSAPIPMPNGTRRGSEATHPTPSSSGLSPTAQPFNASLPSATSPRSRYFGSSPQPDTAYTGTASTYSSTGAQPIPLPPSSTSGSTNNSGPNSHSTSAQFSPVSSPIRTPASFSWVSSGQTGTSGVVGNGGYGFDPFSPHSGGTGMSLSGAASAWQQGNGGTPM